MRYRIHGQRISAAVATLLLVAVLISAVACVPQTLSVVRADGADPWYYDEAYLDLSEAGAAAAAGRALAARAQSAGVEPVIIAVIDTGVDRSVGDIVWDEVLLKDDSDAFVGYNSYLAAVGGVTDEAVLTSYDNWRDSEGNNSSANAEMHGTKVAGAIAEMIVAAGLQEKIKIYPIKASEEDTSKFTVASVAAAVERANEIGADVINLSLCSSDANRELWEKGTDAERLKKAIAAASADTVIVAAAGNFAKDSANALYYPAAYDNVVGVMSYGKSGTVYTGSNGSNYGEAYDIFAPGESVEAGSYTATGTSMACCSVSTAAAMLTLNLRVQSAETGTSVPRSTALSRLLCSVGEGDKTIADPNGRTYKAVNLTGALTVSIDDVDVAYLPVSGINITGETAKGATLTSTERNSVTVQTVRENYGQGKSLVTLTADLLPEWDVDPAAYGDVVWTVAEYTETVDNDGKVTGETVVEGSLKEIGKGQTVEYLFDEEGLFRITASVSGTGYSAVMDFSVSYSKWTGSEVRIVTSDYVASEDYIKGKGNAPSSCVTYGKDGVTLTLTAIEDMNWNAIVWKVDGKDAGNGATLEFVPEDFGEHTVYAYVYFEGNATPYKVGAFVVDSRSYAEHPGMIAFWCVLGAAIIAVIVVLAVRADRRRKAAALVASAEGEYEEESQPVSPIRKERSTPPPPPEPVKKSKRRK